MHHIDHNSIGTRRSRPLAAALLSLIWLLPLPTALAQNQPPIPSQGQSTQGQSTQGQSTATTLSDQMLSAAAAAIGQVSSIRQSYEQRIAGAPSSDKQRLTNEANEALEKAVTDQGLSVDEYNSILRMAQNDPSIRRQLAQRIHPSD
jgi:Domain of unknown function (DUF4168)